MPRACANSDEFAIVASFVFGIGAAAFVFAKLKEMKTIVQQDDERRQNKKSFRSPFYAKISKTNTRIVVCLRRRAAASERGQE